MTDQQNKKPVVRDDKGRIVSGTPNPGGRPKSVAEVVELARQHTPSAIARLAQIMLAGEEKASVAAARELLDRAWGKAPQKVEVDDMRDRTTAELIARAEALLDAAKRGAQ